MIGVIGPDRLLKPEGQKGTTISDGLEESLSNGEGIGEEDSVEEDNLGERPAESAHFRQFSGATALALPSERALRLDALNLELQMRPQSPNGIIFFASAAAPRRQKDKRLFIHSLEVQNGLVQYKFSPAGQTFEIAQSSDKVPLNELTNVRVLNDGRGKVTLQIGSARPIKLAYSSNDIAYPSNAPSRVFIGGMDPKRAKHFPKMINFIGSIGHVKINGKSVELDGDGRAESVEGYPIGGADRDQQESSLDQGENQCSSEPCRNGGRCQLTRWGFECHCSEGYAGNLCQLPSTDGICPGGQRLCAHGVCVSAEDSRGVQCLCPPGWEGMRCERESDLRKEAKGIHFDGKHSFLALPLGAGVEEGGQIIPRPYSIELRLSPERRRNESRQQLIGAMVGARGEVISAIGMQEEKFWMVHREGNDQPSTKRFLTKRIKHINTHHLRIEPGDTLNEMNVLVEGRPKGVLKGEAGADGILLLGGMPPRGIAMPEAIQSTLVGVVPFKGCVEELLLNGRVLSMAELRRDGYTGANLQSCGKTTTTTPVPTSYQAEEEEGPSPTELDTFSTSTLLPPTAPPIIFTVSEDPNLAIQHDREGPLVGTVGTIEVEYDEVGSILHPATTTAFPEEIAFKERPSSFGTTVETSETPMFTTVSPTPEPTTIVPAPPRPIDQRRPDSITQVPEPPYTSPTPDAPNIPSTITPRPVESAEIEGPFVGLCEESTCGAHGHCEEVNETHVLCECRDYYVGQFCEEFRPIEYAAKFDGSAFVVFSSDEFPHLSSEQEESVKFKVRTRAKYGLIIWQGQQPSLPDEATPDDLLLGEDFLSIGILDGHLSFSFELGGGAAQILSERPVDDGKTHSIKAIRRGRDGWLTVDNGTPMIGRSSGILAMLNVEGHVFVGGVPDLHEMTAGLHTQNFVGCLAELALNGQKMDLMHSAIDGRNLRPCRSWQPNRMRRRRKWMRPVRKQRKAAEHRRAALGG